QDERAAGLAGDEVVHQRSAQVAHMDVARGRRREAGDGHDGYSLAVPLSQAGVFVHMMPGKELDMNDWLGRAAPDLQTIEQMARSTVAELAAQFAGPARAVLLRVEDFAPDGILDDLQIEDPFELTGLYDGIPMTEK